MSRGWAEAPALVHHFTRGLRFDTQVQSLQGSAAKTQRWLNVPQAWNGKDGRDDIYDRPSHPSTKQQPACMALCLAQCLTVLGYPGLALVQRLAPPDLDDAPALAQWLTSQDLALDVRVLSSTHPKMIGAHALTSIQLGAACAVCLASAHWQRWVWLTGVESTSQARQQQARALLVLDGKDSPPWACGHNARIELAAKRKTGAGRPDACGQAPQLIYRHLDGQATTIRLCSLVLLRPEPTSATGHHAMA